MVHSKPSVESDHSLEEAARNRILGVTVSENTDHSYSSKYNTDEGKRKLEKIFEGPLCLGASSFSCPLTTPHFYRQVISREGGKMDPVSQTLKKESAKEV